MLGLKAPPSSFGVGRAWLCPPGAQTCGMAGPGSSGPVPALAGRFLAQCRPREPACRGERTGLSDRASGHLLKSPSASEILGGGSRPVTTPLGRGLNEPSFPAFKLPHHPDEETEVQRGQGTCARSHSWENGQLGIEASSGRLWNFVYSVTMPLTTRCIHFPVTTTREADTESVPVAQMRKPGLRGQRLSEDSETGPL